MQLIVNAVVAWSLAALLAGGLALVYGVLGVFNMALGQTVLFAGLSAWWLTQVADFPVFLSIPLGIAVGGVISLLTFEIFVRPFYRLHRFLPLVTTIALSMMLDGAIMLLFGERPHSILSDEKMLLHAGSTVFSVEQMVLVVSTLSVLCVFAWVFHSTACGRRIRAAVQHEAAARSLGINTATLHRAIFIVSGVFAGGAGIFIGIDQNLSPTFAFPLTIKAYAAIIAGGKGNIWGAVACAYLIALLEQLLVGVRWFGVVTVPAGYQQTVALLFIILILLAKPAGLFSGEKRAA